MTATTEHIDTDDLDRDFELSDLDGETDGAAGRKRRRRAGAIADRPTRSKAAQRAIDRRARRAADRKSDSKQNKSTGGGITAAEQRGPRGRRAAMAARLRRVPFVVPVLGLLVLGLGLSLWLSTTAAQDSYQLGIERQENQALVDRRDQLKREYESGDSAPELSDKATQLGLVPSRNPARMVVDTQGRPEILGEPAPADGRPMGTINPHREPDPAEQIDPDDVYDSLGLDNGRNDNERGNGAESPPPAPGGEGAQDNPLPPADEADPAPAPAPPAPGGPAPNVLPPNGNPPSANSPDPR